MDRTRIGKFYISREFFEDSPELVKKIQDKVLVCRLREKFETAVFEYVAYCEEFEKAIVLSEVPVYNVVVSDGNNIEFVRNK